MKSLKRMLAIADKEWIQIRRDSRSLILALLVPSLLVALFGYALNVDVKNISMAVYDQDKSPLSRTLINAFQHTEYIRVEYSTDSYRQIDRLIDSGSIIMAMTIPPHFEKNYKTGKKCSIQLLVDGSDSTSAIIATGYVKIILLTLNKNLLEESIHSMGITGIGNQILIEPRVWYNPELKSKNFIIPGLVVLILAIISALITSLTISREWERGTMESLISTPVRGHEVVLGKLLPYLLIGLFDIIVSMCLGYFVFDVPFNGSFLEMTIISLLFLIGTSSMGLFISMATRVQVLSVQVAMVVTYLPSFILSDFIFPIQNMPAVVRGITYVVPARYLIAVLKGIALKGVHYSFLKYQILFLSIFCVVVLLLSIKKFKPVLPD